ncbi:uncharacterized protein METZ01_LOCUS111479, partial [marine metagenome]
MPLVKIQNLFLLIENNKLPDGIIINFNT